MARKRMFFTFKEAVERGPFDEYPVLPEETDPQLHLSRNDRVQPFYALCGKDTVIVQMSGTGRVEFRDASVNFFDLEVGDFVYVPAGTVASFASRRREHHVPLSRARSRRRSGAVVLRRLR